MTRTKSKVDRKQLRRERLAKHYYEEDTNIVVEDTNTNEKVVEKKVVEKKTKRNYKKKQVKKD